MNNEKEFTAPLLGFDLQAFEKLDEYALQVAQDYNYGNQTDWFGTFRGGYYGIKARIIGVETHYNEIHRWGSNLWSPSMKEYHIGSLFFNLDSAVECFVFALNALGYCVESSGFRDVTDSKLLRRVNPRDLVGEDGSKPPLPGYTKLFPTVHKHWLANKQLIELVFDQHDVSKHRETIFRGGQLSLNPPLNFFEDRGIAESDQTLRTLLSPLEKTLLDPNPKDPRSNRKINQRNDMLVVEEITPQFREFFEESGRLALVDANNNIPLNQFKHS